MGHNKLQQPNAKEDVQYDLEIWTQTFMNKYGRRKYSVNNTSIGKKEVLKEMKLGMFKIIITSNL